jgi:hypothetical protein
MSFADNEQPVMPNQLRKGPDMFARMKCAACGRPARSPSPHELVVCGLIYAYLCRRCARRSDRFARILMNLVAHVRVCRLETGVSK